MEIVPSGSNSKKGSNTYKICGVPQCRNTTKSTPGKLFLSVPKDPKRRSAWEKAARRLEYAPNTTAYFCEDHFEVGKRKLIMFLGIGAHHGITP